MRLTRLVASTKLSERDFWNRSLLGRSLLSFPDALRPELWIRFENTGKCGLPEIYNRAIEQNTDEKYLLFVHDDVFLHDVFLQHRIAEGLARYDVIGLAGSRGSDPAQPSWGLAFDENLRPVGWQKTQPASGFRLQASGSGSPSEARSPKSEAHPAGGSSPTSASSNPPPVGVVLSGGVSHVSRYLDPSAGRATTPAPALGLYGTMPAECDLLDGLFLAANGSLLREWNVRFDERFRFHLYDLDFCRTARSRHLRLGTWPLLASHGSGGNFDSEEFRAAARLYLEKWKSVAGGRIPSAGSETFVVGHRPPATVPRLIGCARCGGAFLPENMMKHSAWHAAEDAALLESHGIQSAFDSLRSSPSEVRGPNRGPQGTSEFLGVGTSEVLPSESARVP